MAYRFVPTYTTPVSRAVGAGHGCIQALNPNEAKPALPDEQILAARAESPPEPRAHEEKAP